MAPLKAMKAMKVVPVKGPQAAALGKGKVCTLVAAPDPTASPGWMSYVKASFWKDSMPVG